MGTRSSMVTWVTAFIFIYWQANWDVQCLWSSNSKQLCSKIWWGIELTRIWSFLPPQSMWCNSPGLFHFCKHNWPENGHFNGEELNKGCSLLKPRLAGLYCGFVSITLTHDWQSRLPFVASYEFYLVQQLQYDMISGSPDYRQCGNLHIFVWVLLWGKNNVPSYFVGFEQKWQT